MLHSLPTLFFKSLIPRRPIQCLLPPPFHHHPLLLAVLLRLLPPLPGFSNGMLEVFESEALNYFTLYRPILLTLSVSRNPISTHLPLSGFLNSLLCILIAPTTASDATHASGGIIFVRQGLSFSELSTSLSSLDLYSNYVGVSNSSLSFLNVYATPRRMAELTPILSPFFFLQKSFYSGGLQLPSLPLELKRHFQRPRGGRIQLTSSPSIILTFSPFYIAPYLTFPFLPSFLLLGGALGLCFLL